MSDKIHLGYVFSFKFKNGSQGYITIDALSGYPVATKHISNMRGSVDEVLKEAKYWDLIKKDSNIKQDSDCILEVYGEVVDRDYLAEIERQEALKLVKNTLTERQIKLLNIQ